MKYEKKHREIIATLLQKAGMNKESEKILKDEEHSYDIGNAIQEARTAVGCDGAVNKDDLLDAVRRYETRHCPLFDECPRSRCEGAVCCRVYNLGGSHGSMGDRFHNYGRSLNDIDLKVRKDLMRGVFCAEEFEKINRYIIVAKHQYKLTILLGKNEMLPILSMDIREANRNQKGNLISVVSNERERISLAKTKYTRSVKILKSQAIYMISLYITHALESCFNNRDNFKKLVKQSDGNDSISRIDDIWLICKWIRNGFSHNSVRPKWYFEHKNDFKELTVIEGINLKAKSLHDKDIELGILEGPEGFYIFVTIS